MGGTSVAGWTGDDPAKIVLESMKAGRRYRDKNAERIASWARPVMLVDVLECSMRVTAG